MQVNTSAELSDWMSARFESFRESLELDHIDSFCRVSNAPLFYIKALVSMSLYSYVNTWDVVRTLSPSRASTKTWELCGNFKHIPTMYKRSNYTQIAPQCEGGGDCVYRICSINRT